MESAKTSAVEHDTATMVCSAKLITLLNRYVTVSMTIMLETAIANQVQQEDKILPSDIALTGNKVSQLWWNNFDVNEEMPSGAGTTHFTHGILIQELQDGYVLEQTISVNIPRTKDRSPKPINHNITTLQPLFTKRQVEPVMPQKSCISEIDTTEIATSRMDESALESIDRQHPYSKLHLSEIPWVLSRSFFNKDYTVPDWSGWISKMAVEKTNFKKSQIGYLAPILFQITEYSTVQECHCNLHAGC